MMSVRRKYNYNMFFHYIEKIYDKLKNFAFKNEILRFIISKNPLLAFFSYLAGKDLIKKAATCSNLRDYVKLALSYEYSPFNKGPSIIYLASLQIEDELYEFCKKILNMKPKIIMEIGTANGGTLFLLSRIAGQNSTIISIDLPIKPYIGGIDYKSKLFFTSFSISGQNIHLIRDDSHQKESLFKVKKILDGKKIDILFIDGDHTYVGVKKDFEMYYPLVKDSGIIAFHDIVEVPEEENVQVDKFWNEIKEEYNTEEIVKDWNQGKCGIGLLYKNK